MAPTEITRTHARKKKGELVEVFNELPGHVNELVNSFLPTPVIGNSTYGLTQYMVSYLVALLILIVVSIVFLKKQSSSLVPQGRFVNGCEAMIEYTKKSIVKDVLGPTWRKHFPFIATMFFFILINNVLGVIPGCKPGTGSIGVTSALAVVSFVYFIAVGIKKHRAKYLVTFAHGLKGPIGFAIAVIEIFSTLIRLFTLAIRLFGNMFAGHVAMGTFALMTSLCAGQIIGGLNAVAIGIASTSIVWQFILIIIYMVEIIVAGIQAFVFSILTAVYIQLAEEDE